MTKQVTQREWELIDSIRNYRKTYPLSISLEAEIMDLLDILTDKEYDAEETAELQQKINNLSD